MTTSTTTTTTVEANLADSFFPATSNNGAVIVGDDDAGRGGGRCCLDKRKKKKSKQMASLSETLGFAFECGAGVRFLFAVGFVAGILHGLVHPAIAYIFSGSMSRLSGVAENGLGQLREFAFILMYIGLYSLVVATIQTSSFELVAFHASRRFRGKVRVLTLEAA